MPDPLWPSRKSFRAALLVFSSASLVATLIACPVSAQNASVGIYSDASGNTCSFTGDDPGLVTAYVVIRPDARGVTGVRFAAPIPACFGATFIADIAVAGAILIGDSQTGISVALPSCASHPVNVLQILYQRTGGTTPCCEYPILPDPVLTAIEATDCAFQDLPVAGVVSYLNADSSCACTGNSAPSAPSNPFPQDNTAGQGAAPLMSWFSYDIDDNLTDYDLYLGISPSPALVASGLVEANYVPAPLDLNQLYYWRVVARDARGLESTGPVWTFRTRSTNAPPIPPQNPSPLNGQVLVALDATLGWGSLDPDGDAVVYDVYFGTLPDPPLVAQDHTVRSYSPPQLDFATQYFWRIVASDGLAESSGPTWTFTTRPNNSAPNAPSSPAPPHFETNVNVNANLAWHGSDLDGDPLTYDVYFGTVSPPPLVASNIPASTFEPGPMSTLTVHYWRIVARDGQGGETSGPEWRFTTRSNVNTPPNPPSNPNPPNHGTASITPVLTWSASDPDDDPLTYQVYFGTDSIPPLAAVGLTVRSYAPGTLAAGTRYFWRIRVSDGSAFTNGFTWTFTTNVGGNGDVDNDGVLTVDDARCALRVSLGAACGGAGALGRADVDCNGLATPRDARCIHKQVVDGSCTFCGGGPPPVARDEKLIPALFAYPTWAVGDTLVTQVFVYGVPSLEAFGFQVHTDFNVAVIRAVRFGATYGWPGLLTVPSPLPGFIPATVGGYTLSSVPANSMVGLVEMRFVLTSGVEGYARFDGFLDDLFGANPLTIRVSRDGGGLPVFISRFEAVPAGDDVEVRWEFSSDEPVESFTLYRRDAGAALPVAIATGDANFTRSYTDRTVQAGTTYRYELVIRTQDGDEYRSQVATVTTLALRLSLGQNHPNPFNPVTTIPFEVPGTSSVRLFVLDATGRVVRTLVDEKMPGGSHSVEWNGKDQRGEGVSSGVYFYVLDVAGERRTRKMVLLK